MYVGNHNGATHLMSQYLEIWSILSGDHVSISEQRSCVDLGAVLDSLVSSLDLRNLHVVGNCRERIKI